MARLEAVVGAAGGGRRVRTVSPHRKESSRPGQLFGHLGSRQSPLPTLTTTSDSLAWQLKYVYNYGITMLGQGLVSSEQRGSSNLANSNKILVIQNS